MSPASGDWCRRRRPVGLNFEVLHRVGDVGFGARDAGLLQAFVEEAAGGADEGAAGDVLLVAGLFADKEQRRADRAFAEHHLRRCRGPCGQAVEGEHLGAERGEGFLGIGGGGEEVCCWHGFGNVGRGCGLRGEMDVALAAERRGGGAAIHHGGGPARRLGDQARDGAGFGQVAPVLHRHLGAHGGGLQPGRVEDAAVVGAPEFLLGVLGRSVGAAGAGADRERGAVPVRGGRRRQDRPAHGSEAADEEAGFGFEDVVLGLEPGNEAGAVLRADFAEADECVHLVGIAADGFFHGCQAGDVGVGGHPHQGRLAMGQAPEHAIKQGEALRVAVADGAFGQFNEGAGDGRGGEFGAGRGRVRGGTERAWRCCFAGCGLFGQIASCPRSGRRRAEAVCGHAAPRIGGGGRRSFAGFALFGRMAGGARGGQQRRADAAYGHGGSCAGGRCRQRFANCALFGQIARGAQSGRRGAGGARGCVGAWIGGGCGRCFAGPALFGQIAWCAGSGRHWVGGACGLVAGWVSCGRRRCFAGYALFGQIRPWHGAGREQAGRLAGDAPFDGLRRHLRCQQPPGSVAPTREVGGAGEEDVDPLHRVGPS